MIWRNLLRGVGVAGLAAGLVHVTPVPPAAAGHPLDELRYDGEMTSRTTVLDTSGNGLDGTVLFANDGAVVSVADPDGDLFLRFPGGTCADAPCPQAVVQPADSATLVPGHSGTGRFAFGADIRLTEQPSQDAGMNVLQFGFAGPGHHQWKLQADYGYPSCRWSDGTHTVLLGAAEELTSPFEAGVWYRVRCSRLSQVVFEIRVLHPETGQPVVPPVWRIAEMGAILPSGSMMIGGKRVNPDQVDAQTDQYHGDLDAIYFRRW